jgi:hypothetical protein
VKALKMFAGLGNGRPCDGCERPITAPMWITNWSLRMNEPYRLQKKCLALWHQATANDGI